MSFPNFVSFYIVYLFVFFLTSKGRDLIYLVPTVSLKYTVVPDTRLILSKPQVSKVSLSIQCVVQGGHVT